MTKVAPSKALRAPVMALFDAQVPVPCSTHITYVVPILHYFSRP
jgi:hypothetical protein